MDERTLRLIAMDAAGEVPYWRCQQMAIEILATRKDAERFRWLATVAYHKRWDGLVSDDSKTLHQITFSREFPSKYDLREAIEKAMNDE